MTVTLRPYQAVDASKIYGEWQKHQTVLHRADTGYGKCLGRGTPVLLFDGRIVPVETVKRGDQLMGPDGKPRTVLTTCAGRGELYRVTPAKGDAYVVNAAHVLSLQKTRKEAHHAPAGEIVNLPVTEYIQKAARWRHVHKGWRSDAVDFPSVPLVPNLPPYILGSWLGDGHAHKPAVTTMDAATLKEWLVYADTVGLVPRFEDAGGKSVTLHVAGRKGAKNPLVDALRAAGVWQNKHIPHAYQIAGRADRLELLAGLLDTDGYLKVGGFELIQKRREIVEGAAFVSRSLGMAAYITPVMKSCNGAEKELYWRLHISGDTDQIPCRVSYKKALPRRQIKSVRRVGITVEAIGPGDYFGFELVEDGLFLLGDFTVTHNTAVLSYILANHIGASIVIAHRDTIVSQLSLMLARFGIRHNIIASTTNCRQIADLHVKETGRNWYDPNARCAVASVDTLVRRKDLSAWLATVTLAIVDEGHHVVTGNKWHTAITLMTRPDLKILLPTATPRRPDGKGLGREPIGDGIADVMVEANPMSWLMDQGYLTRYYPPLIADSHMAEAIGKVGATGDWSTAQLRSAAEQSTIVGDVVAVYTKVNTGQYRDIPAAPHGAYLDVVFAPDVKTATEMLHAYRAAGYKAELLTGETDAGVRRRVFQDFERRAISVIIAVDIISEGTDMPAVEMVQQARLTASIVIYMQQFGRGLRPLWPGQSPSMDETLQAQQQRLEAIAGSDKPALIYVDHVGNFLRHGPPDRPRDWSLARTRGSNGPSGAIPSRVCLNVTCAHPYERVLSECPYCGTPAPPPAERSSPDVVDGDIVQMDPAVLDALLGKVKEAGLSLDEYRAKLAATGLPQTYIWANAKKHDARLKAQEGLRDIMALWGGRHHADGRPDDEIRKLFWFAFGVDVLTAKTLGPVEAEELAGRVALDLA